MTAKQAPRHRGDVKPITPISDITDTFGVFGRRSVAVASATGVALTAAVASTASATAPTVLPQAPAGDFVSNLEVTDSATLVSLDLEWDSGDTVGVKAEEPAPEPEPEPEPEYTASRAGERESYSDGGSSEYVASYAPPARLGSVVDTAFQFLGVPYVYGGASPAGFDCSGFTSYVYGLHGISLSRSSYDQAGAGVAISAADAQPGDLVIMNGAGHVGIYIGGGQIIHSPRPGKSVEVASLAWFSVDSYRRL